MTQRYAPYRRQRRIGGVIPDKDYASKNRYADRDEHPIGKFVPMLVLHIVECLLVNQFPSSENVYLMRPDCAYVVEAKSEIEKKKQFGIHGMMVDCKLCRGNP